MIVCFSAFLGELDRELLCLLSLYELLLLMLLFEEARNVIGLIRGFFVCENQLRGEFR